MNLRVTEIFYSLQGETNQVGLPTVFVRLTGCPLRCQYCDTAYAFKGGELLSIENILLQVKQFNTSYVTVTGGEPLAQKSCLTLLTKLADAKFLVALETSGALDISAVDSRIKKIVDIKTPDSKESARNHWQNLNFLSPQDEIKFVICSRSDYDWSKDILCQFNLINKCNVLFSPSYHELSAHQLAEWILADRLPVRFQIQLHKVLWGEKKGC